MDGFKNDETLLGRIDAISRMDAGIDCFEEVFRRVGAIFPNLIRWLFIGVAVLFGNGTAPDFRSLPSTIVTTSTMGSISPTRTAHPVHDRSRPACSVKLFLTRRRWCRIQGTGRTEWKPRVR
jgi:hypothetical protein